MVSPVGTGLIPGGRLLAGLVALLGALATSAPVTLPNVYPPGVGAMPRAHANSLPDPWSSGQAREEASQRAPMPLKEMLR